MQIARIQNTPNFYNTQSPKKKEFIDIIADNVKNPRDINDCVAVPRGIFKAYIYLMIGSAFITATNFLPASCKKLKSAIGIAGAACCGISAIYFAKPFAVKGLSPTVKKEPQQ